MNTLIFDKEISSLNLIELALNNYFPDDLICFKCHRFSEAQNILESEKIDLLFWDTYFSNIFINDFLNQLNNPQLSIILTSSTKDFNISSIPFYTIDFLIKPIQFTEVKNAVQKVLKFKKDNNYLKVNKPEQVSLKTNDGKNTEINIDDIMYINASNNYSIIYLLDNKEIITSKTLKEFDLKLNNSGFLRIHKSYLINKSKITSIKKSDVIKVTMSNGIILNVSRRKKHLFNKKI